MGHHSNIETFVQQLTGIKAPSDDLEITIAYTQKSSPGVRGHISTRQAGRPGSHQDQQSPTAHTHGTLTIGDSFDIRCRMRIPGYLHLFNLGSSGCCAPLYPEAGDNDIRFSPDEEIILPRNSRYPGDGFTVSGPATAECGGLDRLLLIHTVDKQRIAVEDLSPALHTRGNNRGQRAGTAAARAAGFADNVPEDDPLFFESVRDHEWQYILLAYQVIKRP